MNGGTTSAPASTTTGSTAAPKRTVATGDPKQLLKDGRKALAEGRFADAQDLAAAADSSNPNGKWGIFDDTPTALRRDIQVAKAKADKLKSEELVKQAKALAAKPAANDGERAYNLETAIQMARKADQLHGPSYTLFDMSDRPEKVLKDLQEARAKLKVAATPPPATTGAGTSVAGGGTTTRPARPAFPSSGPQTAGTTQTLPGPQIPGVDPKKATALKLMAEGREYADRDNFVGARAKFDEADKLGATFGPDEVTPAFARQELSARGSLAMDKLIRDAQTYNAQRDYPRSDAALKSAAQIAATLGLFPRPVAEARATLYVASNGQFGERSPSGIAPAGGPERLVRAGQVGDTPPVMAPGTQTVYNATPTAPLTPPGTQTASTTTPTAPPAPPAPGSGTVTGRQFLDQATVQLAAGDFDTAERLARMAHNQGMQTEAARLLTTIDTERFKRNQRVAAETVANAKLAYQQKNYQQAFGALAMVDVKFLTDEQRAEHKRVFAACKLELDKAGLGPDVVVTGARQPADKTPATPADPMAGTGTNPPGTAHLGPDVKPGADNPTAQADALRSVQIQKLRAEGLKVQTEAQAAFGRGETDFAMQMLLDYCTRVRTSGLDSASANRLLTPVMGRLETFRLIKGQTDAGNRLAQEKKEAKDLITNRSAAEEERKQEVARLVRQYHDLVKKNDYVAAERVALQAKQLEPDDPAVGILAEMAKMSKRIKEAEKLKSDREEYFKYGLDDAEKLGPLVTASDPVAVQLQAMQRANHRGSGDNAYQKSRTAAEYEIEQKLDRPISIHFIQTPLDLALKNIESETKIPLWLDLTTLQNEHISEVQLVTYDVGAPVAAKHVLGCILESAGLSYVVENDMVKVTTTKKAKGRMVTKVFSVADLVTPVPNFALPDYANLEKMLHLTPLSSGNLMMQGLNVGGNATPTSPPGGLGGGTAASTSSLPGQLATMPGIQASPFGGRQGGTLQTDDPLSSSAHVAGVSNSKHEQLIKLITSMVRPYTWDGHGGAGKVEFYDIGSALVVNQTADVITEVQDLLEALRRLQDLSVAVEIRIVSLSESFFERMGIDFSVNILTNTNKFQPQLTTNQFAPTPFINSIGNVGQTVGLTPAGTFTQDLNVPVTNSSFQRAIPAFGGYPNTPGDNGGLSLGLAFLNDIQVYMFMEMAQGDRRINIMQAPKVTLFNGQTATLTVNDLQFYVASVQVVSVNGQLVFVPQNTPLPIGVTITVQAVVSADRRFVRMNLPVNLTATQSTQVPLFPITTFLTPVFEGGSQGQPVPFTQFIQQPTTTNVNVQTTVVCPDGGTVLLGGLKTLQEGRNEYGPPFLSNIPYLNRLFKNVGVGRDSTHVMIMVTPRIIINSEEEIFQTEGRQPNQGNAQ